MKISCRFLLLATVLLLFTSAARAGGPENVLLVVNEDSLDSLAIANHFIQLRNIPPQNVVYLKNIPDKVNCYHAEFRDRILKPVIDEIAKREIGHQIDYIVYSAGFPTGVGIKKHVEALKAKVTNFNKSVFIPKASINALTYFYQEFLSDSPSYMGMDANWYARRNVFDLLDGAFVGELQEEYSSAIANYKAGKTDTSSSQLAKIVKDHPLQVSARYYLARSLASEGKEQAALRELELCVRGGWCYRGLAENDKAFASLRENPRFKDILDSADNILYGQLPTRGFTNRAVWSRNGWPNGDISQGKQFVLSTVLAVTTGRGNTLDQAIAQLKRSAAADGTHPTGTFFFSKNKDKRTKARASQFPQAITELRDMGFGAEQISAEAPVNRDNVLGATLGYAKLDWPKSRSVFAPGAICDNLTSYGGTLAINPRQKQTPCTHFLANGAAGASGTVTEPLAIPNKFPDARLHVHYVRGCTLAEAFYQSVRSPFQLLIVGDPLCCPWGKFADFSINGIENDQTIKKNFVVNLKANKDSPAIGGFELYLDGRKAGVTMPYGKPMNIGVAGISDGYHELRIVAVDETLIGTRTSKRIQFFLDQNGKSVSLKIAGNGKYQIARTITVTANANCGEKIEVFQNSRSLGVIPGRNGKLTVDCSTLGQGPSTLQAMVVDGDEKIASKPVAFEIVP